MKILWQTARVRLVRAGRHARIEEKLHNGSWRSLTRRGRVDRRNILDLVTIVDALVQIVARGGK